MVKLSMLPSLALKISVALSKVRATVVANVDVMLTKFKAELASMVVMVANIVFLLGFMFGSEILVVYIITPVMLFAYLINTLSTH